MNEFDGTVFEGKDDGYKTYFAEHKGEFIGLMNEKHVTFDARGALWSQLKKWYESHGKQKDEGYLSKRPKLEENGYRPITITGIRDYESLLGKYISVDNAEFIWSDTRKDLNPNGRILMTSGIIGFLDLLKDNFVDNKPKWDGLLVKGMSGSGKSVAFALGAAYLSEFEAYNVFWFRRGEEFDGFLAARLTRKIQRESDRVKIIFVDQVDKLGNRLDTFIGSGSENNGVFTIGCASGNARVVPSSSRATRVKEQIYNPSIDYELFCSFFEIKDSNNPELSNFQSTGEMLTYTVCDYPSLFIGTRGHFLSMAEFRKEYQKNSDFRETWGAVLKSFSEDMSKMFEAEERELMSFYSQLHRVIFFNNDLLPHIHLSYKPDLRYIHDDYLFSPLFVQSYRIMLLLRPPSRSLCTSLSSVKDENPSVAGFCIERYCIENSKTIEKISRSILERNEISFVQPSSILANCGTYCYDKNFTIPEDVASFSEDLRMWTFIPLEWNEKGVDMVLVFTLGSKAAVLGIQITLQSVTEHSGSLSWFHHNYFVQRLGECNYEVLDMLLFLCNPAASELTTCVETVKDKLIFDFPLYGIISDTLNKKIVKSNANSIVRRITLKFKEETYLSTHAEINNAKMPELRSFCRGYGGKKCTKKEEACQYAFEIHRKMEPLCLECHQNSNVSPNTYPLRWQ